MNTLIDGNQHFQLFACCIPVKGASRSTICDLQRYNYELIPNDLYDIIENYCTDYTINEIKSLFEKENADVIDGYFQFLLQNEFGFVCDKDEMGCFPLLAMNWESPSEITNAIIDSDRETQHDWRRIAKDLDMLGCKALELRFFDPVSLAQLKNIVQVFNVSRLKVIYIKIKFDGTVAESDLEQLCIDHQRIKQIQIHSSPEPGLVEFDKTFSRLEYTPRQIESADCCGNISAFFFRVNTQLFTESQHYNSCLNRKIGIDKNGYIKNCPSASQHFGHHKEKRLADVVFDPGYRKLWSITRDQVKVCKDCEFRYICTDCRIYIEASDDLYSKPLKCKYDPYTATWET